MFLSHSQPRARAPDKIPNALVKAQAQLELRPLLKAYQIPCFDVSPFCVSPLRQSHIKTQRFASADLGLGIKRAAVFFSSLAIETEIGEMAPPPGPYSGTSTLALVKP